VAAASAALDLLIDEPDRVERLRANAETLRAGLREAGLDPAGAETQIVPVVIGDAEATMALTEHLLERGIFAQGIRPPTVPPGTCRLRLTTMATHRRDELRRAATEIGRAARELGVAAQPPRTRSEPASGDGAIRRAA
jgi:glycine C-acetyltransferase